MSATTYNRADLDAAVAAEREACAQVTASMLGDIESAHYLPSLRAALITDAIRARGDKAVAPTPRHNHLTCPECTREREQGVVDPDHFAEPVAPVDSLKTTTRLVLFDPVTGKTSQITDESKEIIERLARERDEARGVVERVHGMRDFAAGEADRYREQRDGLKAALEEVAACTGNERAMREHAREALAKFGGGEP